MVLRHRGRVGSFDTGFPDLCWRKPFISPRSLGLLLPVDTSSGSCDNMCCLKPQLAPIYSVSSIEDANSNVIDVLDDEFDDLDEITVKIDKMNELIDGLNVTNPKSLLKVVDDQNVRTLKTKSDSQILVKKSGEKQQSSFFGLLNSFPKMVDDMLNSPSHNRRHRKNLSQPINTAGSFWKSVSPTLLFHPELTSKSESLVSASQKRHNFKTLGKIFHRQKPILVLIVEFLGSFESIAKVQLVCHYWNSALMFDLMHLHQNASILCGIPDRMRLSVYSEFVSNVVDMDKTSEFVPGVITNELFSMYLNRGKKSRDAEVIYRDVPRTFGRAAHRSEKPPIKFGKFRMPTKQEVNERKILKAWEHIPTDVKQRCLTNVLLAASGISSKDRYCQGQDRLVAYFMRVCCNHSMKVIRSSWYTHTVFNLYVCLLQFYGLSELYSIESGGIMICMEIFMKLLHSNLPRLCVHMLKIDFSIEMIIFGWFQTLFCGLNLPYSTISRIIDWWIVNGRFEVFFRAGLAILKLNEESLLQQDFEGFAKFLSVFPDEHVNNADRVISTALSFSFKLKDLVEIEKTVRGECNLDISSSGKLLMQCGPLFPSRPL